MAAISHLLATVLVLVTSSWLLKVQSADTNGVYSPCSDTTVQRHDGFTFGIAFASRTSFFYNGNSSGSQLSPCDSRLSLSSAGSQVAAFRPKVDEISLLTINTSSFSPVSCLRLFTFTVFFDLYCSVLIGFSIFSM